jgi:hypothetical protein
MSKKLLEKGRKPSTTWNKLLKWLDSFDKVSAAVEKHGDLKQLLKQGGGICKVENFLPDFVAEGIYQLLETFTEEDWNVSGSLVYSHLCSVSTKAPTAGQPACKDPPVLVHARY